MKHTTTFLTLMALLSAGGALAQGVAGGGGTASPNPAQPDYQIVQTPGEDKSQAPYQKALQTAVADFQAGRLTQAEAGLQDVEQKSPSNVTAHSLLGYIYLKENKSAQALREMQTVVRLAPNEPGGRKNLGRAFLQTGKNDQAIAEFQAALAHDPSDADAQYGLGIGLGQAGRNDEAAAAFRKAIASHPTSATYQNLGVVLQKGGHGADAAAAYAQAATLDPKNSTAFLNAGLLYAQAGDNDRAIPALKQALALDTDSKYEAHMALGQAYAKSDTDQAIAQFALAAQLRPTEVAPVFNQAVLQTQLGNHPQAEASYRKVIDLAPSDAQSLADAKINLGLLLAQDGNAAEAVPLLTQAAEADPKNPAPHLALGNLYSHLGNTQKANEERLAAVNIAPDDVQTRLLVADSMLAHKQYTAAAAQYDEAVKRQPDNALVQNARGTAYEMAGNLKMAQASFVAALSADPKSAQAQNNLGVVYEKQGKKAQALAAYKKALALDPALSVARKNLARLGKS